MGETHGMPPRSRLALAGFLAVTFAAAGVSSLFTIQEIPTWYANIHKPTFNPPNEIFGPTWTLLYLLMAIAAWLVWKEPASRLRSRGLLLYWVQLALNFAWSLIFLNSTASVSLWRISGCCGWRSRSRVRRSSA